MKKHSNKLLVILAVMLCGVLFCSYSKNNNKTVKGYIHVYGNEPFTYIGIETTDNKKYAISAAEEEIAKLWKTQGSLVEIEGIIIPKEGDAKELNMLKDGKIEVSGWKLVK